MPTLISDTGIVVLAEAGTARATFIVSGTGQARATGERNRGDDQVTYDSGFRPQSQKTGLIRRAAGRAGRPSRERGETARTKTSDTGPSRAQKSSHRPWQGIGHRGGRAPAGAVDSELLASGTDRRR
jgi:hypothetical protein